jgi:hypothetical protein
MKPAAKHPLPDSRERKDPPQSPVVETNYQRLRALVAWLNYPEAATSVELGVSVTLLRGIMNGTTLPDQDCQTRILVMSRRWPHGLINIEEWPKPPKDRRGEHTKAR